MSEESIAESRDTVPYVLRHLANVWDNSCGLPEPVSMLATNTNGIATIQVADLDAVKKWARVLGATEASSSLYAERGPIHSAHVWNWHGWVVYVTADEEDGPRYAEEAMVRHDLTDVPARTADVERIRERLRAL